MFKVWDLVFRVQDLGFRFRSFLLTAWDPMPGVK